MAKKENNHKNYAAREAWEKRKREDRPMQMWAMNDGGGYSPVKVTIIDTPTAA